MGRMSLKLGAKESADSLTLWGPAWRLGLRWPAWCYGRPAGWICAGQLETRTTGAGLALGYARCLGPWRPVWNLGPEGAGLALGRAGNLG